MSTGELFTYVATAAEPVLVGRLWARASKGSESATFLYDDSWLAHAERFALEPALSVGPGPQHTRSGKSLFGAIGDSAPDRWGRALLARAEQRTARSEHRVPRTLREIDFLLGVSDESRQGALRFSLTRGGPFLAEPRANNVPPLVDLPRLLAATERILDDSEDASDLRLLLAPGTSLGGARPKASVRDTDGALAIAKFSTSHDDHNVALTEGLALSLAARAGIAVPAWRTESVGSSTALIVRRFDRVGGRRVPFLSAMSMLGAIDGEQRSYLEIIDALSEQGSAPVEDRRQLWKRMVFTVLVSNVDDHLRNHAFLHDSTAGWRLSPAYDINPTPTFVRARVLATAIDESDTTASIETCVSVAEYFGLEVGTARSIARDVAGVTQGWRAEARRVGLTKRDIERLESAFEHDDLRVAMAF